jgi:tetratricopeptide (TPR) repeat protein
LIGLILLLIAFPAWAQDQQLIDVCYSPTATDDQTIESCSTLISSGRYSGIPLAGLYASRSDGYIGKSAYPLAIQDASQAITLDPTDASAFNNRCIAFRASGYADQAIADCDRAIALESRPTALARVYVSRGQAYEAKGLRDQAISDYRSALRIDPNVANATARLNRLGVSP